MSEVEGNIPIDSGRLDRIEQRLDQMTAAVISLARVEERLISHTSRMDAISSEIDALKSAVHDLTEEISKLKDNNSKQSMVISFVERIFWIIATAVASLIAFSGKIGGP